MIQNFIQNLQFKNKQQPQYQNFMESAINVPQSKSVSIAFIALKSTALALVLTATVKTLSQNQDNNDNQNIKPCSNKLLSFASIIQIFNLLGCILDFFAIGYFYFKHEFRCLQYYVFYGYHMVLALVTCIGVLTFIGPSDFCSFESTFLIAIFVNSFQFVVLSIVMMWSNLYFSLKFGHFGSNLVWFSMWFFAGGGCSSMLIQLIAGIHGILSFFGFFIFIINRFIKKTAFTARCWKILTFISLLMMIFCYILILIGLLANTSCQRAEFFQKSYQIYGLIQLLSPILLLIFLRSEYGDPRQKIIKNHQQVFQKLHQNQFIDLQQKQ